MADYARSKGMLGEVSPENAIAGSPLGRLGPLITPDELKSHKLFGIPLVSATKNPLTNRYDVMSDDLLAEFIDIAVSKVEEDIQIRIYPVQIREKHPFDRNLWEAFGHINTAEFPILSLEKFSVTPSNGYDIFVIPPEWIEPANFLRGQINIVPMTIASVGGALISPVQSGAGGGAAFINIMGMRGWVPAFWQVEYTAGFAEGKIPKLINDLIGIYAAIDVLGNLSATNRQGNYSLSIDGLSQSASTPGPQVYAARIQELEAERVRIVNRIKARFGKKLFVSSI